VRKSHRNERTATDKLEITVRPEKMTLTSGESGNRGGGVGEAAGAGSGRENACALRGTLTEVVYLGTSTNYNVTTSAGAEVVVFTQNTSAAAEQPPQRDDAVWLHWDPANSYPIGSPR
jgi:spermidine/putrescine transport system ATP-binding protein